MHSVIPVVSRAIISCMAMMALTLGCQPAASEKAQKNESVPANDLATLGLHAFTIASSAPTATRTGNGEGQGDQAHVFVTVSRPVSSSNCAIGAEGGEKAEPEAIYEVSNPSSIGAQISAEQWRTLAGAGRSARSLRVSAPCMARDYLVGTIYFGPEREPASLIFVARREQNGWKILSVSPATLG